MEKKKKLIILGVILLLIIVSGATFAILTWNSTMIKLGINTNCFTIDYTKGVDITGSLKLMNENDLISSGKFTIKEGIGISGVNIGIKSSCSIEGLGNIYLNVSNISNALTTGDSKSALKYVVLKNTSSISNPSDISVNSLLNQSFDIVTIGSVDSSDKKLLYYTELSNTEIYKYIIAIYIDKALAGNDITEATFSGNISSDAEQLVATPDYCFSVGSKDDTNMTATICDYYCYEGNSKGYDVITDVVIPKEIYGYTINSLAFSLGQCGRNGQDCGFSGKNLKKVFIPDSVTTIKEHVFSGNQLTSINIPNSVTTIEREAFAANQLTGIVIPNSVTTILTSPFKGNPLTNIIVDPNNSVYDSRDNSNAIIETSSNTLVQGCKNTIIPDVITTIGDSAFSGNQLADIIIPDSVTTIGDSAFSGNQLTSINIPDSVTTIGSSAFSYNNLNYVYIGSNSKLTSIRGGAFSSIYTDKSDGITYVDNPNLKKIYYNGSNQLPWIYAVNWSDSSTKFVTGTVPSYTSGTTTYNEVLITTGK